MFWFILAFVVVVGLGISMYRADRPYNYPSDFWVPFTFMLAGGFMVAGLLCMFSDYVFDDQVTSTTASPLANLSDGSQTTGSFFLGSGRIEGRQYFAYYANDGDGSYTLEQQPASLSKVRFTDGEPFIMTEHLNGGSFWFAPWANHGERYTFYVPKGSIDNHYTLDAK